MEDRKVCGFPSPSERRALDNNIRRTQKSRKDFGSSTNVKITSADSGIETGNDSNDSAGNPSSSSSSSSSAAAAMTFFYTKPTEASSSAIEEIDRPLSSMSTDVVQVGYSANQTPTTCSSLVSNNCGPLVVFNCDSSAFSSQILVESQQHQNDGTSEQKLLGFRKPIQSYAWWSPYEKRQTRGKFTPSVREQRLRRFAEIIDPEVINNRRLRGAVASNNVDQVRRLLASGVKPNASDALLRTPLHLASGRGYTEVVRLLLRYGADPSLKDCIGNTPLHLAVVTSKISVVTLLLEAGTDPLSLDNEGYNPLQLAETKLRLLQNCKGEDMLRIKSEVHEVVNMLVAYLKNRQGFGQQVDALSTFCSRLTLSNTSNQVQDEVRDLLCNIDSLSLKS